MGVRLESDVRVRKQKPRYMSEGMMCCWRFDMDAAKFERLVISLVVCKIDNDGSYVCATSETYWSHTT